MRLYVLSLLRDGERHGYQIIRSLKEQIGGDYTPSAGSVYPRLRQLEREGLVEARQAEGRVLYQLTKAGKNAVEDCASDIQELETEVGRIAHDVAADLRADVRRSTRKLRAELRTQSEALRTQNPAAPFSSELETELARFSREWTRLLPSGSSRSVAKSCLSLAVDAALRQLRETLDERNATT